MQMVSAIVTGLRQNQAPRLLDDIARQLGRSMKTGRMKTGIWGNRLVGVDDTGRFISTTGSKLKNGYFATESLFGTLENGAYSKIVPGNVGNSTKDFIAELTKRMGLKFDMNRTKTGIIDSNIVGIEETTGRFITATREKLANGDWGVISRLGQREGCASKIVNLD